MLGHRVLFLELWLLIRVESLYVVLHHFIELPLVGTICPVLTISHPHNWLLLMLIEAAVLLVYRLLLVWIRHEIVVHLVISSVWAEVPWLLIISEAIHVLLVHLAIVSHL